MFLRLLRLDGQPAEGDLDRHDSDNNQVAVEMERCIKMKSLNSSPKQRTLQASGNDNRCYLDLPPTPSMHPEFPVTASTSTRYRHLEVPTSVRLHSPLHIQKLHLQLFPMDERTRKFLEEENHCPYLELTITTKKKIASVIRHLNIKWGNSRSASEELTLFPYDARMENLERYKRWTLKDSDITASEVHAAIGKPAVFRLRYVWLNNQEKELCTGLSRECESPPAEPPLKQVVLETAPMKTIEAADNVRPENDVKLSWIDCVSNMSFGALLSEVEAAEGAKVCPQAPQKQIAISCDSFDAAIAAHILRYQAGNQSSAMVQPSILDAEETCNPFSFHNSTSLNKNVRVQSQVTPIPSTSENAEHHIVKPFKVPSVEPVNTTLISEGAQPIQAETNQFLVDCQANNQEKEEMQVDMNATINVNNQFEGLDMHWPPSAGPWQFLAPPPQLIISSDSNGLNGLDSTRLDTF
ncbi:TSL-kinase interacting protein 1 isoform X4 [Dendrobium catenatum]|uniref:TSL-kinase interacting protein 1 isoform X4 n=1 Tax=Dendrobium catenatum TaxID=906689 RepID=UPI00109F867D|nr:TSL-kinase interacting protein 1 isoform X4 [Dendrobium catenatum]